MITWVWGNLASATSMVPGKKEKAIEYYKEAINLAEQRLEINPSDATVLAGIAGYYAGIENKAKAIQFIQSAIEYAPHDVGIMYRAATTYEEIGNREKALHWIKLALQNGYSPSEIKHQPELKNLLADSRYQEILAEIQTSQSQN